MSRWHTWRWAYFRKVTEFSCTMKTLKAPDVPPRAFPSIKATRLLQDAAEISGPSQILHIKCCVWATQPWQRCHISKHLLCERTDCACVCGGVRVYFLRKWEQFCGFCRSITQNNIAGEGAHCSLCLFNIKIAPKLFLKSTLFFTATYTF